MAVMGAVKVVTAATVVGETFCDKFIVSEDNEKLNICGSGFGGHHRRANSDLEAEEMKLSSPALSSRSHSTGSSYDAPSNIFIELVSQMLNISTAAIIPFPASSPAGERNGNGEESWSEKTNDQIEEEGRA